MLINKLFKMQGDKIKILEQSILNNWQDIYELKENNYKQKQTKKFTERQYSEEHLNSLFTNIDDVVI